MDYTGITTAWKMKTAGAIGCSGQAVMTHAILNGLFTDFLLKEDELYRITGNDKF